jgi:hypothetical protein
MYIYRNQAGRTHFGEEAAVVATTDSSKAPTELVVPESTATSNWTNAIQNLIPLAKAKDWVKLQQNVSQLLANKELVTTLVESLQFVQSNAAAAVTKPDSDPSNLILSTLNIALKTAKKEAASTVADRIRNEEILSRKLDNIIADIRYFKMENKGVIAIWNKISGKEKTLFAPIKEEENNVLAEIKITPLTDEGRTRLTEQYNATIKTASAAWSLIGGSTALFMGLVILEIFKTYAGTAASAVVRWGVGKTKERAVEHASKLHRKYIKKEKPSENRAQNFYEKTKSKKSRKRKR